MSRDNAHRYALLMAERYRCETQAVETEDGWTVRIEGAQS